MAGELSPQIERLIAEAIAGGMFPSREALLETAAERLLRDEAAAVPPEHVAALEQGLDALDAGRGAPWTSDDVAEVLRRGRERLGIRE